MYPLQNISELYIEKRTGAPKNKSYYTRQREKHFFEIRPVETEQELQEIFKFRYRIYVSEMSRKEPWADHTQKILREPLDSTAELLGVYHNDKLVGIGRLNFAGTSKFEHEELFEFNKFEQQYPNKILFISRLMIDQKLRKTSLFLDLCRFIFARAIEEGIEVGILNCNYSHLLKTFEHIGFRPYKGTVSHPDYGVDTTPMAFYVNDMHYLKKINSPLLSFTNKIQRNETFYGVKNEKIRHYFRALENSL